MALTADQQLWARRRVVADVFGAAPVNVTKAQIDQSVNACVAWIETNATSAVAAMNGTPLAAASDPVKARVLALAIQARYGSAT